jgi:hypothetical protein
MALFVCGHIDRKINLPTISQFALLSTSPYPSGGLLDVNNYHPTIHPSFQIPSLSSLEKYQDVPPGQFTSRTTAYILLAHRLSRPAVFSCLQKCTEYCFSPSSRSNPSRRELALLQSAKLLLLKQGRLQKNADLKGIEYKII